MTATPTENGTMLDTPDGPGCLLHVQEVGMAAPSVINALLKIRGTKGKIAADIQVHEDGGRVVEAGEEFFLVFSTNPPGKGFKERFDIDSALARALVWKSYPDELSKESMQKVANTIFDFTRVERRESAPGAIVDLSRHPELAKTLGEVALRFNRLMGDKLRDGEPGRKQKIPITIDSLWKVAELLQNHQVPDPNKDQVDFVETVKTALKGIYVDPLRDKPGVFAIDSLKQAGDENRSLGAAALQELDALLTDKMTGLVEFNGIKMPLADKLVFLTDEIFRTIKEPQAMDVQKAREGTTSRKLNSTFSALGQLLDGDIMAGLRGKLGGNG
jgi:hypothetical protein